MVKPASSHDDEPSPDPADHRTNPCTHQGNHDEASYPASNLHEELHPEHEPVSAPSPRRSQGEADEAEGPNVPAEDGRTQEPTFGEDSTGGHDPEIHVPSSEPNATHPPEIKVQLNERRERPDQQPRQPSAERGEEESPFSQRGICPLPGTASRPEKNVTLKPNPPSNYETVSEVLTNNLNLNFETSKSYFRVEL